MYFDKYLNRNYKSESIGVYCDLLAKYCIGLYHYDNKKYWGRINKIVDSQEIDYLDQMARKFNEKRAYAKNKIDEVLNNKISSTNNVKNKTNGQLSFQVFPISLMIDMLVTENIRIYDFSEKHKLDAQKRSIKKSRLLMKTIDEAFERSISQREYDVEINIRTFDK